MNRRSFFASIGGGLLAVFGYRPKVQTPRIEIDTRAIHTEMRRRASESQPLFRDPGPWMVSVILAQDVAVGDFMRMENQRAVPTTMSKATLVAKHSGKAGERAVAYPW